MPRATGGAEMYRKTDRRAALKLLTAAPLGLAISAALAREAVAQTPHGTFGTHTAPGRLRPSPKAAGRAVDLRQRAAERRGPARRRCERHQRLERHGPRRHRHRRRGGRRGSDGLPRVRAGRRLQRRRRHHPPLRPLQVERPTRANGLAAGGGGGGGPPGADDLLRPRAGRGDAADRRLRGIGRRAPQ